ncbi:hypothetical protein Fcan01_06382 [Folsomia candida]|uniref:Uncharacterized protein n=1 Tax=Folsomia candida TaxID=158441 RepID=A0A226EM61_FOLCA|nr:hypothetical protein Fcan01_06382 [Folsomia candida]
MKISLLLFFVGVCVLMSARESEAVWGAVARGAINIGRKIGGSGKPVQHFKNLPNRKAAENAARNAGKGNTPVRHTPHQPGQTPHFHPADRNGNIIKDGSHYGYPNKG